jgi:hypothetical protein
MPASAERTSTFKPAPKQAAGRMPEAPNRRHRPSPTLDEQMAVENLMQTFENRPLTIRLDTTVLLIVDRIAEQSRAIRNLPRLVGGLVPTTPFHRIAGSAWSNDFEVAVARGLLHAQHSAETDPGADVDVEALNSATRALLQAAPQRLVGLRTIDIPTEDND